jgi:membrane fusion protein (multidrug efflux system)
MNAVIDEKLSEQVTAQTTPDGHGNGHGVIPKAPGSGKKKALMRAGAAALALALGAGTYFLWSASHYESTDDAFIDGHIIPISSRVAGEIAKVSVVDNQLVKAGDPLAEIDPRDYEAKLAEERGKVAAAEAEALRAAADARRYEKLFAQDEVSRQQLDNAEAASAGAQAAVAKERGALTQDELNLSYTKLIVPESGRVTGKSVEEGAYVQVGQALLAIVPDNVWVTANFKETQLTHMNPGQPVTIEVDAYPGRTFRAHVDSLQSGTGGRFSLLPPENATGNYVKVVQRVPVKIVFDEFLDARYHLAPGMSVVPSVRVR